MLLCKKTKQQKSAFKSNLISINLVVFMLNEIVSEYFSFLKRVACNKKIQRPNTSVSCLSEAHMLCARAALFIWEHIK